MDFTIEDFDLLIEAVKAWESNSGKLVGEMFSAMLGPKPGTPDFHTFQAMRKEENAKERREEKLRSERSVILRAKLIQARDSLTADRVTSATTDV